MEIDFWFMEKFSLFGFDRVRIRYGFIGFLALLLCCGLPQGAFAQGMAHQLGGMQVVLDQVYREMLPLCARLIDVGRGIAGFAALWYIAHRVWKHLASAEPIDFYPLLRPFGLGMAIILFPVVISVINGVLQPTVSATGGMVKDSNKAIEVLLKRKQEAIKKSAHWQMFVGESGSGDIERWYKYTYPKDDGGDGFLDGLSQDLQFWMEKHSYAFRNSIKQWMSEILEVLYAAASLCINTLRTFFLIVLAILGPLVFGFAVFDGFQHTLSVWLARYINIFLWLPIANIFGSILGKIQENMLKLDLSQIAAQGDTFFSATDTAYLIFLVIGIVGYFSVPNVANYVVHAGGGNAMLSKVNSIVMGSSGGMLKAGTAGGMAAGAMARDGFGALASRIRQDYASSEAGDYFKDGSSELQKDRIKGS